MRSNAVALGAIAGQSHMESEVSQWGGRLARHRPKAWKAWTWQYGGKRFILKLSSWGYDKILTGKVKKALFFERRLF